VSLRPFCFSATAFPTLKVIPYGTAVLYLVAPEGIAPLRLHGHADHAGVGVDADPGLACPSAKSAIDITQRLRQFAHVIARHAVERNRA
jgi:hypothetical protein